MLAVRIVILVHSFLYVLFVAVCVNEGCVAVMIGIFCDLLLLCRVAVFL